MKKLFTLVVFSLLSSVTMSSYAMNDYTWALVEKQVIEGTIRSNAVLMDTMLRMHANTNPLWAPLSLSLRDKMRDLQTQNKALSEQLATLCGILQLHLEMSENGSENDL